MGKIDYPSLFSCFEDVSTDSFSLEKVGFDKKMSDKMTEMIKQRIKPPIVIIEGSLQLVSYAPDGVEIVREALKRAQKDSIVLNYKGGGQYKLKVTAEEYKIAE